MDSQGEKDGNYLHEVRDNIFQCHPIFLLSLAADVKGKLQSPGNINLRWSQKNFSFRDQGTNSVRSYARRLLMHNRSTLWLFYRFLRALRLLASQPFMSLPTHSQLQRALVLTLPPKQDTCTSTNHKLWQPERFTTHLTSLMTKMMKTRTTENTNNSNIHGHAWHPDT